MLMIYLLYKNGKFIAIPPEDLYELAIVIAKSKAPIDDHMPYLVDIIGAFITDLEQKVS